MAARAPKGRLTAAASEAPTSGGQRWVSLLLAALQACMAVGAALWVPAATRRRRSDGALLCEALIRR